MRVAGITVKKRSSDLSQVPSDSVWGHDELRIDDLVVDPGSLWCADQRAELTEESRPLTRVRAQA